MTNFTGKLILLIIFTLLSACGGSNTRKSDEPDLPRVNYTLPNGEIIKGYRRPYKNGFYIGEMKNGEPHGKGAFIYDSKTSYSTGTYSNGRPDGLQKTYNTINGLATYNLIKDGKLIQTYGELDALLAAGDFDKAAAIRGPRVFLGIQLQDDRPYVKALKVSRNSPADLAGIMKDDRLLALNNTSLVNKDVSFTLRELIKLNYDQSVDIKIQRSGQTRTIRMIPGIIPSTHTGTMPSSRLLWNKVRATNASSVYQQYIDTIVDNTYKAEASRQLAKTLKQEQKAFDSIKPGNDDSLIGFCLHYPSSTYLADALGTFYQQIENGAGFIKRYNHLTGKCEQALKYQPAYYELLSIGPDNMNVKKLLMLLSNGMSSTLIATKIKTAEHSYRDFNLEEISYLTSFGLKDDIISAMIESTYAQRKSSELEARLKKLEEENRKLKQTQAKQQQTSQAKVNDEKNMPLECIKLATALKACNETSGFLSMGCKAVARSQFDCPIPLN